MAEKKRKYIGKPIAEKLEITAEVNKKERSKNEIAQAYGIPLSTLSTYLKNQDSIKNQALQGAEVSKQMRIRGAKHSNLEEKLFEWFCHARANNIHVESPMVKEKANEIALKTGIEFQCLNGWLQQFKQ
jgi:transposase-like protein